MGIYQEEFLVGECGLSEREACLVTFRETEMRMKAAEKRRLESWEVARWEILNHINLSPNIKRGDKPKRVEDILRLPTDKPKVRKVIEITEDEIIGLREIGLIK